MYVDVTIYGGSVMKEEVSLILVVFNPCRDEIKVTGVTSAVRLQELGEILMNVNAMDSLIDETNVFCIKTTQITETMASLCNSLVHQCNLKHTTTTVSL